MCKFCDNLINGTKNKLMWNVRSTYAHDNVYEFMEELNGYEFVNDQSTFCLAGHIYEGNVRVGVEYEEVLKGDNIGEIFISPFTEYVQFNYCPMCGKQISKDIKGFTGDGNAIYLEENE